MIDFKSQLGQDKWIVELFKNKKNGYFIDIGAWDGEEISNTYYLEKALEWTGICVEPQLNAFNNLRRIRTCIAENVAISDKAGVVFFKTTDTGSSIVTGPGPNVSKIQTITIEQLLKRHRVPTVIDYLSVDTEGNELEIMRTFPYRDFSFRALTIEHNSYMSQKHVERRQEMRELLEANGYVFVKQVDCDDWYVNHRVSY